MNAKHAAAALVAALLAVFSARAAEAPRGVATTPEGLAWKEMSAKAPGVMIATVKGDYLQGPWAGFIRFPAGSKSGLHTHSGEMKIVIVSGTFRYGPTAEAEKPYGPGSYVVIPRDAPHTNSQPEGCLMYIEQDERFDNKAAVAAK